MSYLFIFIGGGIGAVFRVLLGGWIDSHTGQSFPWGTIVINILGSFTIGLVAFGTDVDSRYYLPSIARQFIMLGILGGFTTFSSFSLQTLQLARDGEWFSAALNVTISLVLCLVGVWLGALCGQAVNR